MCVSKPELNIMHHPSETIPAFLNGSLIATGDFHVWLGCPTGQWAPGTLLSLCPRPQYQRAYATTPRSDVGAEDRTQILWLAQQVSYLMSYIPSSCFCCVCFSMDAHFSISCCYNVIKMKFSYSKKEKKKTDLYWLTFQVLNELPLKLVLSR